MVKEVKVDVYSEGPEEQNPSAALCAFPQKCAFSFLSNCSTLSSMDLTSKPLHYYAYRSSLSSMLKRPITELNITQLTSKRHKTSIDNSCSIGRCRNKWPIIHTIIPCLWWNKVSVIPVYEGKHIAQWSIIHTIIPLIDFYQLVIRSVWYLSMMWAHVNCGAIHMLRPFNGEIVEGVHTCLWCVLKLNVTWFFFSCLLLCFPLG